LLQASGQEILLSDLSFAVEYRSQESAPLVITGMCISSSRRNQDQSFKQAEKFKRVAHISAMIGHNVGKHAQSKSFSLLLGPIQNQEKTAQK
jgi:hypothetical protein